MPVTVNFGLTHNPPEFGANRPESIPISRLVITHPTNFLEARFWITSEFVIIQSSDRPRRLLAAIPSID